MTAAISLEGVSKHLSGRQVLKDVSFAVEPGDIFGCLGPNGAGKTTTIRIILGLLRASAGTARVLGSDPGQDRIRPRHVRLRLGLAFLSGLVLVPVTVFLVSMLVSYIQLVATNPRMGNLVYGLTLLVVWGVLFFSSYYLPLVGVSIDYYPLIFLGLILLLSGGCYLCSRSLTKEKVVLSSKG
jgi:ABC transporter